MATTTKSRPVDTADEKAVVAAMDATDSKGTEINGLREALVTFADAAGFLARPNPRPDGDWICDSPAGLMRKTWRGSRNGGVERVHVRSAGLAAGWHVSYSGPGTDEEEQLTDELSREAAFTYAETLMADLSEVPRQRRTGRASDDAPW